MQGATRMQNPVAETVYRDGSWWRVVTDNNPLWAIQVGSPAYNAVASVVAIPQSSIMQMSYGNIIVVDNQVMNQAMGRR